MYLCVKGIDFNPFYDFDIGFRNCFDNVTIFGFSFYPDFNVNYT